MRRVLPSWENLPSPSGMMNLRLTFSSAPPIYWIENPDSGLLKGALLLGRLPPLKFPPWQARPDLRGVLRCLHVLEHSGGSARLMVPRERESGAEAGSNPITDLLLVFSMEKRNVHKTPGSPTKKRGIFTYSAQVPPQGLPAGGCRLRSSPRGMRKMPKRRSPRPLPR